MFEGWLEKKGRVIGFWHKRFCTIDDNIFNIYSSDDKKKIKRTLELNIQTKVDIVQNNGKFQFNITSADKVYSFQARNETEYIEWLNHVLTAMHPTNTEIARDHFEDICVLGRGFYGKVTLARHKSTGKLVAIKSIHKRDLMDKNKVETVMAERTILAQCDSPFIVKLLFSFQTPSKFYLVLEYEQGGDLFNYIKRSDPSSVTNDTVKMIIAELALALNHLHQHNIIYRDLKPENVLFCKDGHIKLTDFGISKVLSDPNEVTRTLCGTSEYLAPEVIQGKDYSFAVDWWQLGTLMYELIVGRTPFGNDNRAIMYQNITSKRVGLFPVKDQAARELISHLLKKNPAERAGFEQIKHSNYFKDFDWDLAEARGIQPKYIPQSSSEEDVSNFDSEITKESPLDSIVMPVASYFNGFNYISPEYKSQ